MYVCMYVYMYVCMVPVTSKYHKMVKNGHSNMINMKGQENSSLKLYVLLQVYSVWPKVKYPLKLSFKR